MAANAAQLRMAKRKKDAVKQNRQGWDSGNDGMGQGNDPDAQPWWNIFLGCCAGGRDDGLVDSAPQNTKELNPLKKNPKPEAPKAEEADDSTKVDDAEEGKKEEKGKKEDAENSDDKDSEKPEAEEDKEGGKTEAAEDETKDE